MRSISFSRAIINGLDSAANWSVIRAHSDSADSYLSNCMLPPLASTSCTDMLIPLLLSMNGLLFDAHKFELEIQRLKIIRETFAPSSVCAICTLSLSLSLSTSSVFRSLPRCARGYSSYAEYPSVADAVARRDLRRLRAQTQHAYLADVTVAVANPDVPRSLPVRQCRRRAGELKSRSRLPDRQRSHEFGTGSPVG